MSSMTIDLQIGSDAITVVHPYLDFSSGSPDSEQAAFDLLDQIIGPGSAEQWRKRHWLQLGDWRAVGFHFLIFAPGDLIEEAYCIGYPYGSTAAYGYQVLTICLLAKYAPDKVRTTGTTHYNRRGFGGRPYFGSNVQVVPLSVMGSSKPL